MIFRVFCPEFPKKTLVAMPSMTCDKNGLKLEFPSRWRPWGWCITGRTHLCSGFVIQQSHAKPPAQRCFGIDFWQRFHQDRAQGAQGIRRPAHVFQHCRLLIGWFFPSEISWVGLQMINKAYMLLIWYSDILIVDIWIWYAMMIRYWDVLK